MSLNKIASTIAATAIALAAIASNASTASALSISPMPDTALIDITSSSADDSCDLWGKIKSRRSTGPADSVEFNFVNETNSDRMISWLDFKGNPQKYVTLAPGASMKIDTFFGHSWLIQDGRGDCMEVIDHGGKMIKLHSKPKQPLVPIYYNDFKPNYEVSDTRNYGGYLNLRSGPSMHHSKFAKLPEGYAVKVLLLAKNGWAKVKMHSGQKGWVNAKYLAAL